MQTNIKRDLYLSKGHLEVEGWVQPNNLYFVQLISKFQSSHEITGDVLEIGVHHGRFFIALHNETKDDELSYAIDVFEDQDRNIDRSGRGSYDAFVSNIQKFCNCPDNVLIIKKDSLGLDKTNFIKDENRGVRLVSIDGGHMQQHVVNDLKISEDILSNGGVVFVDDYLNPQWPGVHIGVGRYYAYNTPWLVPFAYTRDKLLLCSLSWHKQYYDFIHNQCGHLNGFKSVNMYGFDVVVTF